MAEENFFDMMQTAAVEVDADTVFDATYGFAKLMACFRCAMMEVETKFRCLVRNTLSCMTAIRSAASRQG